jgi:hypothetical protein
MQKKFNLSSDGADSQQEMQIMLWWGLVESAFGVSLESGSLFCVFTFNLLYKENL